jgi:hypothetical protein
MKTFIERPAKNIREKHEIDVAEFVRIDTNR